MQRLTFYQGGIFVLLWLTYGSTYFLRKPLGVVKADLESELHVNPASLGWLDTALLLPYAGVSLLLGSLGDYFGPRITLAGGIFLAAAATIPMAVSQSFPLFLVLLAISGAGQALCWPAACSLLSLWFSDKSRNSIFGMFGTCCFAGGMGGTGLAVYLQAVHGWHGVFIPPAIIVATLGFCVLLAGFKPNECGLVVPGRAADKEEMLIDSSKSSERVSMIKAFKIALVPEVSVAMFCVKAVRFALMFWLPLYLLRTLNYSQVTAGLASTAFEMGGIFGSVIIGVVVDKWMGGQALLTSAISVALSAVALIAFIATASMGPVFHILFLAIAGAMNCGPDILLAGSIASDIGEREGEAASAVTGVVNGMGSLGTVFEGPMVSVAAAIFGYSSLIPLMVILSGMGAAVLYRANAVHNRNSENVKIPY